MGEGIFPFRFVMGFHPLGAWLSNSMPWLELEGFEAGNVIVPRHLHYVQSGLLMRNCKHDL